MLHLKAEPRNVVLRAATREQRDAWAKNIVEVAREVWGPEPDVAGAGADGEPEGSG